jgi:hypothetical protein
VVLVAAITVVFATDKGTKPDVGQADRPTTTSVAAAPPPVTTTTTAKPPPDINTLLMNVGDTNMIVGTTNLSITKSGDRPDDSPGVTTPRECQAAMETYGTAEYGSSGFIAMRWQVMLTLGSRGVAIDSVVQVVTQFATPTAASGFIENLTTSIEACRGKPVTATDSASGETQQAVVDAVTTGPNEVSDTLRFLGSNSGLFCQLATRGASSFVVVASACGSSIGDTSVRLAQALATRIETA